jgi:hypothetical protein
VIYDIKDYLESHLSPQQMENLDAKLPEFLGDLEYLYEMVESKAENQLRFDVLLHYHFGRKRTPSLLDVCTPVNPRFGRRLDVLIEARSGKRAREAWPQLIVY